MTLSPQKNALGPSAGTIALNRREGCPSLFLAPGFQAGKGHQAACRQGESRSQEEALLLIPSPPTLASLTCSAGPKQCSCKPAFHRLRAKLHLGREDVFFFFPFLKAFVLIPMDKWESELRKGEGGSGIHISSPGKHQGWRPHCLLCLASFLVLDS